MCRFAFLALVVSSVALATKPTRPVVPCEASPEQNAKVTAEALEVARRVFPEARGARPCAATPEGSWGVGFGAVSVQEGGVTFSVNLGAGVEPQRHNWRLAPFESREVLAGYARRIKEEPLVASAAGSPSLTCLVSAGSPGEARLRCSPAGRQAVEVEYQSDRGPLRLPCLSFEFVARPRNEACGSCPEFQLEEFSMPLAEVTEQTPGWCRLDKRHLIRSTPTEGSKACLFVSRFQSGMIGWRVRLQGPGQAEGPDTIVSSPATPGCIPASCQPLFPCGDRVWTTSHENGRKKSEETFKDGRKEGPSTTWYPSGQKRSETNFKDNQKSGLETTWYESGRKQTEVTWKGDKRDGTAKLWRENGQLEAEIDWKDGVYVQRASIRGKSGKKRSATDRLPCQNKDGTTAVFDGETYLEGTGKWMYRYRCEYGTVFWMPAP